jgi:hypothetical protein
MQPPVTVKADILLRMRIQMVEMGETLLRPGMQFGKQAVDDRQQSVPPLCLWMYLGHRPNPS